MNKTMRFFVISSLFIIGFFAAVHTGKAIKVGIAEVDITPDDGVRLWGYSTRTDPSEGSFDPLKARAIVFDDGLKLASIVTLDLGRTFPEKILSGLRKKIHEKYNLSQLLITATHTHAAPGYYATPGNDKWLEETLLKVELLIGEALNNKKEARFKVASGTADLSYERRVFNADGSVEMMWVNFERKFIDEIDQTVRALFIEELNGNPIVTLVHYACHPVMTGNKNLKTSADFPAYMAQVVEEEIGGMCMFIQGAAGNINPYMAAIVSQDKENGLPSMKKDGYSLGKTVVALNTQAKQIKNDSLQIKHSSFKDEFETRYPLEDERIQKITQNLFVEDLNAQYYYPEVTILTLGDEIAWAGFPGEFFDDFQTELLSRSPFKHTYFVGYCNGHYSYFPTIEAAAKGGYGADYSTLLEAGTGEVLLDEALVELFRLSGKLEGK